MSIANLEVLHKVTSLHSLCFFSKVYKKQETRRTTFNFSVFLQNFANQWKFFPMKVIGTHNIFSKEKYSIFGKIFSGGSPRTPQMLLISISVFMQNFPNRGILSKTRKTRGPFSCPNRGMVQTEGCL